MNNFKITDKDVREIVKKLNELTFMCRKYKTPFFFTMAIENDEKKTKYATAIYTATAHDIELNNDLIRNHELVQAGFDVVPQKMPDLTQVVDITSLLD